MRTPFTGVGTALITPFTAAGALDEAARAAAGAAAGRRRHRISSCRAGPPARRRRSPPTSGAGSSSSSSTRPGAGAGPRRRRRLRHAEVAHAAREMQAAGADGLLSVTPYYNKPTPEGCSSTTARSPTRRRCRSSSTTCPAGPAATSTPATCARLATIPTIVGVKEASGNIQQMAEICRAVPDDFSCSRATTR